MASPKHSLAGAYRLQPGDLCGGYVVEGVEGRGGQGVVYRARSLEGELVALKTLDLIKAIGPKEEERFRRECTVLYRLDHPNIVGFLKAGRASSLGGDILWLAMEYLDGPSLDELVHEEGGRISHEVVLRIAKQLAEALRFAHETGVIHRDLKPSNIKFRGGVPKIIDFGIASVRSMSGLTSRNEALGTFKFMAPEQFDRNLIEDGRIDGRADVFALGLIMWTLVAGHHPVLVPGKEDDVTVGQMCATMMFARFPRLDQVAAGVPGHLADLVEKAIAHDRNHRYADMGEFSEAITGSLNTLKRAKRPLVLDISGGWEFPPSTNAVPPPDSAPRGAWTPNQPRTVPIGQAVPPEALAYAKHRAGAREAGAREDKTTEVPTSKDPLGRTETMVDAPRVLAPSTARRENASGRRAGGITWRHRCLAGAVGACFGLLVMTSLRVARGARDETPQTQETQETQETVVPAPLASPSAEREPASESPPERPVVATDSGDEQATEPVESAPTAAEEAPPPPKPGPWAPPPPAPKPQFLKPKPTAAPTNERPLVDIWDGVE